MSTFTYGRCRGCGYAQIITSDTSECSHCGGWASESNDVRQAGLEQAAPQRKPNAALTVVDESMPAVGPLASELPGGRAAIRSAATPGEQLKLF